MNLFQSIMKKNSPRGRVISIGWTACLLLVFLLAACGDGNVFEGASYDDSYQARRDDAEIALDDGDFNEARGILLDLKADYPNREEVCELLSNAYAGLAGFDAFHYLENISDDSELEEAADSGSIDMVGKIIGDENGQLSDTEVETKLNYLDLAIYGGTDGGDEYEGFYACVAEPNDSQTTQLGLLAVVHSALTIADLTLLDLTESSLLLTEAGLRDLYQSEIADYSDVDADPLRHAMDRLNTNLDYISNSVVVLDEKNPDNDINEAFSDFVYDLDPDGDGLDENGNDLAAYINNL